MVYFEKKNFREKSVLSKKIVYFEKKIQKIWFISKEKNFEKIVYFEKNRLFRNKNPKNFFYFETLDDDWLAVGLSVDRSASQINASKDVSFFGKEFRKFLLPPLRIWTLGILLISTLDQGFLIPAQDSHTLYMCIMPLKEACVLGSGCGSVGRVVAPDIRGPWIESRYW